MSGLPLSERFPPATEQDWQARVKAALKGESVEERLVTRLRDGISLPALSGPTDGPHLSPARGGRWTLLQRTDHPRPERANAQAVDDLAGGAGGVVLTLQGAPSAHGNGFPIGGLARALRDIELHRVSLRLEAGAEGRSAALALARLVRSSAINPELLAVSFGMDPIGVLWTRGHLDESWTERAKLIAATARDLAVDFRGPFAVADGRHWHEAGATDAQELGFTLASAVAYLRAFETVLDAGRLAASVAMTLAADQDMFATLAKFRAMRLLWARVLEASGLPAAPLDLHAETSFPMMARLDPHVNILRAAVAVCGAGLGGAASIAVLPFSIAQGLPNTFARRVARNLQLVLLEEANLWRVDDPGNGAGAIEHLTQAFAETAWTLFQDIERRGGLVAALMDGTVKDLIARSPTPPGPMIGVTQHPLAAEYAAEIEAP